MFINVFSQVVILLVLISVGFTLTKAKILTEFGVKSMTEMVLLLVTPCVIIKSFTRQFSVDTLKNLIISATIALFAHITFIILSRILIKSSNISSQKVLQFGIIFSNCGYMSIPLQQAILGDEGVFYGSAYIAMFNLFIWSYGLLLMSGDKKTLSPKKLILNPGLIGVAIGLIIFLFSIPLPKIIFEPVSYIASLNTPLPMIIIGYHLANSNILAGLKDIRVYYACLLKLIIFPLIAFGIMYACGIRGLMLVSSVISCCAPTAAITTMFSSKYNCDTSLSVNLVSISTILSLITIPIIVSLSQYVA